MRRTDNANNLPFDHPPTAVGFRARQQYTTAFFHRLIFVRETELKKMFFVTVGLFLVETCARVARALQN